MNGIKTVATCSTLRSAKWTQSKQAEGNNKEPKSMK